MKRREDIWNYIIEVEDDGMDELHRGVMVTCNQETRLLCVYVYDILDDR